jgi:hypothetical protein
MEVPKLVARTVKLGVFRLRNAHEVVKAVVLFVAVDVVDGMVRRDRTIGGFPYNHMLTTTLAHANVDVPIPPLIKPPATLPVRVLRSTENLIREVGRAIARTTDFAVSTLLASTFGAEGPIQPSRRSP